jgi:membrane-associated phospholipid phosphatase
MKYLDEQRQVRACAAMLLPPLASDSTAKLRKFKVKSPQQCLALCALVGTVSLVSPCRSAEVEQSGASEVVTWQPSWRRSNWLDFAVTGVGFAAAATFEFLPRRESAHWNGPILFDTFARDSLLARSASGRMSAGLISDVALWASVGYVALDATLVTMVAHRASGLGYEMLWMDAEAYAVTGLLNGIAKRLSARARPDVDECLRSSNYDEHCATQDPYASFYSGHAALSATSAGLICAHHQRLSLYGGAWDGMACGAGLVMASMTGALRVVADRHWASDVVAGHLIGFASGYFVPTLMHYRPVFSQTNSAPVAGWFPRFEAAGGSVVVFGVF